MDPARILQFVRAEVAGERAQRALRFSHMDPARIELTPPDCQPGILPLNYGPIALAATKNVINLR